jgi:hypothetical protein
MHVESSCDNDFWQLINRLTDILHLENRSILQGRMATHILEAKK